MQSIIIILAVVALFVVCTIKENYKDVSAAPQASAAVGTLYEVIGEVQGYGMRPHSAAPLEEVLITAPSGIARTTVAWKEVLRKVRSLRYPRY